MKFKIAVLVTISLSVVVVCPGKVCATQVLPVNIAQLAERSDVAFVGTCKGSAASIQGLPDGKGKMLVTAYDFSISQCIKNCEGIGEFKFTQLGASGGEARRLGIPSVIGVPIYQVGSDYVMFLTKESELGLRSPVGLGQGKFMVVTGEGGKRQVVNESGNKNLFVGLPATKAMTKALSAGGISPKGAAGPVELGSFVNVVRELVK